MKGYVDKDKTLHEIARSLRLDHEKTIDFIHDVNNLRGDEWLSIIKEECTATQYRAYKKILIGHWY